jgi:hypothetical protein
MKRIFFLLFLFPIVAAAQSDEALVKQVVASAYIEGIQNRGNIEDIRKGFHPSFNMLRMMDNEIKPLAIEEWITNIEKAKKENTAQAVRTEGKFVNVDITGTNAVVKLETNAVVKLELYRENKKIFTDYLVLYKFTEGWRIVSKTFFRHS